MTGISNGRTASAVVRGGLGSGTLVHRQKEYLLDRRLAGNQKGKRTVAVTAKGARRQFGPAASIRKVNSPYSSALRMQRVRSSTPTKRRIETISMVVLRSRGSTVRRHTASMALALMWLRGTSHPPYAPRLVSITTWRGRPPPAISTKQRGPKKTPP